MALYKAEKVWSESQYLQRYYRVLVAKFDSFITKPFHQMGVIGIIGGIK